MIVAKHTAFSDALIASPKTELVAYHRTSPASAAVNASATGPSAQNSFEFDNLDPELALVRFFVLSSSSFSP